MRSLVVLTVLLAGCATEYQRIRMDVPVGATVTIPSGYAIEERGFPVPFVGDFEVTSLATISGTPMVFHLDEAAAKRLGADRALDIYARLSVGKPTRFARTQTLRLAPSEALLRSLVSGEQSEISAYVSDPNSGNRRLAILTMRMVPF